MTTSAVEYRSFPSPAWASVELALALAIVIMGLLGYIPFSSVPWMLVLAAGFVWWRGPGWRAIGLRRPEKPARAFAIGVSIGVGYQFLGLYVIEPLLAKFTTGELPDVSVFRPLVGDEGQLLFWLAVSWTLAAFMEEMVFRGWLLARIAELSRSAPSRWIIGALGSSVVFGVVHVYQGASGMIATGLAGFVFACVYLAAGRNLWATIIAHGVMDTVGFVMIYFGVYPGI
jgi:membrane protease YdiL (CAAX protease family)